MDRNHRIDEEEFSRRTTFDEFTSAAQALRAWEHRYNYDRFSMALQGLTPAEKLATFLSPLTPDPIITEHAMHTFGGRCLTSDYNLKRDRKRNHLLY